MELMSNPWSLARGLNQVTLAYATSIICFRAISLEVPRFDVGMWSASLACLAKCLAERKATEPAYAWFSVGFSVAALWRIWKVFVDGPSPEIPLASGASFLVTGANTGVGFETTRALHNAGAEVVYMLCRSKSRADSARAEILRCSGREQSSIVVVQCDLCDRSSVDAAADVVLDATLGDKAPLKALVLNAGLFSQNLEQVQFAAAITAEKTLAANHLGHFQLVQRLWSRVAPDGPHPARVVVVSSCVHIGLRDAEAALQDPHFTKHPESFSTAVAYVRSKVFNLWFTVHLRSLQVDAVSLHPGNVRSEVTRGLPAFLRVLEVLAHPLMLVWRKSCAAGARCQVYLALAERPEALYYAHCRPTATSSIAADQDLAARAWKWSMKATV